MSKSIKYTIEYYKYATESVKMYAITKGNKRTEIKLTSSQKHKIFNSGGNVAEAIKLVFPQTSLLYTKFARLQVLYPSYLQHENKTIIQGGYDTVHQLKAIIKKWKKYYKGGKINDYSIDIDNPTIKYMKPPGCIVVSMDKRN